MITVVKKIKVYSPKYLGIKDVVIVGDKIEGIYDNVNIPEDFVNIKVIRGDGKLLFPGFIDSHVHIIGGGGEGSFKTRISEIDVEKLIKSGTTTVVGCLGTDSVCRDMKTLLAKVNALEEEGITAFCYTGSYEIPVKTLMPTIKEDIMLINKIIGIGEIALSDHRSSEPTYDEFKRALADARVAGLLSGKAGIADIHLGDGKSGLKYLFKILEETEIPSTQMLPTHINRSEKLLSEGLQYVKAGGYIDFTTSCDPEHLEPGEVRASEGLKIMLDKGADLKHITFSSDGNGSLPIFDSDGKLKDSGICSVLSLYKEVRESIKTYNVPIEQAISVITLNVSEMLKLKNKGQIKENIDADLVMVDEKNLDIHMVMAKGKILMGE